MKRTILFTLILFNSLFLLNAYDYRPVNDLFYTKDYFVWKYNTTERKREPVVIKATCIRKGNSSFAYVDDSLNVDKSYIDQLMINFESITYPKIRSVFGKENNPGVDRDQRLIVVFADLVPERDELLTQYSDTVSYEKYEEYWGYFDILSYYKRDSQTYKYSNTADLIVVDYNQAVKSILKANAKLAHEFFRMVYFHKENLKYGYNNSNYLNQDYNQQLWLIEGMAHLAETVCGFNRMNEFTDIYFDNVESTTLEIVKPLWMKDENRGMAYLLCSYLYDHYDDTPKNMMDSYKYGLDTVKEIIKGIDINKLFRNFFIANYVNNFYLKDEDSIEGNFSYNSNVFNKVPKTTIYEDYPVAPVKLMIKQAQVRYLKFSYDVKNRLGLLLKDVNQNASFNISLIKQSRIVGISDEIQFFNVGSTVPLSLLIEKFGEDYQDVVVVLTNSKQLVNNPEIEYTAYVSGPRIQAFLNPAVETNLIFAVLAGSVQNTNLYIGDEIEPRTMYTQQKVGTDIFQYSVFFSGEEDIEGIFIVDGTSPGGTNGKTRVKFQILQVWDRNEKILRGSNFLIGFSENSLTRYKTVLGYVPDESESNKIVLDFQGNDEMNLIYDAKNVDKKGLYFLHEESKTPYKAVINENLLKTKINLKGTYSVIRDLNKPEIEEKNSLNGDYGLYLRDIESGIDIDNTIIKIDGKIPEYRIIKDDIYGVHIVFNELIDGKLSVTTFDFGGNNTLLNKDVTINNVVSKTEVQCWPSPAVSQAKIRILNSTPFDWATLLIQDNSGDTIYTVQYEEMIIRNDGLEFQWSLNDRVGRPVSNGVYFIVCRASINGEVQKIRSKMAVVR